MLLAIETSCDETAVAVLDVDALLAGDASLPDPGAYLKADIISSQIDLHTPYGGVVPEIAARAHVTNLPQIVSAALAEAGSTLNDVSVVAATRGPGLKGCLLVGLCYAKGLALGRGVPLIPTHHIEGHIAAGWLGAPGLELPLVALIVSGGHTMLIEVAEFGSYRLLARTRDDAAGEAFDKSATLLGLPYPGGPALSKCAVGGNREAYPLPIGVPDDPHSLSFSGMKTAVSRLVQSLGDKLDDESVKCDVAASVEWAIVRALLAKSRTACESVRPKSFLLTGGVAANGVLRDELAQHMQKRGIAFSAPPLRWCTDNAAMIGLCAARHMLANREQFISWKPRSSAVDFLGPGVAASVGAMPRWPLVSDDAAQ